MKIRQYVAIGIIAVLGFTAGHVYVQLNRSNNDLPLSQSSDLEREIEVSSPACVRDLMEVRVKIPEEASEISIMVNAPKGSTPNIITPTIDPTNLL